jgi:excisionase family DNA binding protein
MGKTGPQAASRGLTVRDVAQRYAVSEQTVLGWIHACELRAINVGRKPGAKKPRWRITAEALAAFEVARTPQPPLPRSRRRKRLPGVIEFY